MKSIHTYSTCFFVCGMIQLFAGDPESSQLPAESARPHYWFNPVPDSELRDLSADRPDGTESPITVDAGHLQLEISFLDWAFDDLSDGGEFEAYVFAAANLKFGLWENTDLQVVFDVYTHEETRSTDAPTETVEGLSDVQLRLKHNVWGNDGGRTAFGLLPFIKIPTGSQLSNDEIEGGIAFPFALDLCDRVGLGLMPEVDVVFDPFTGEHELEFFHTAVLGFEVTEQLGLYTEYIGIASPLSPYQAHFSGGMTFALDDDTVLDAGVVAGLNDAARDLQLFTGITIRF